MKRCTDRRTGRRNKLFTRTLSYRQGVNAGVPLEADPTTLYYYKVGCKSRGVRDKNPQKKTGNFFGSASTPRQDVKHTGLSGSRGRPAVGSGCFVQTGLETTRTSPKALTDKP